jgi:hypothetical protein
VVARQQQYSPTLLSGPGPEVLHHSLLQAFIGFVKDFDQKFDLKTVKTRRALLRAKNALPKPVNTVLLFVRLHSAGLAVSR